MQVQERYISAGQVKTYHVWTRQEGKVNGRGSCFRKKAVLCVFLNRLGLTWFELRKCSETVGGQCHQLQLPETNYDLLQNSPDFQERQYKPIFLHENALTHQTKLTGKLVAFYASELPAHAG